MGEMISILDPPEGLGFRSDRDSYRFVGIDNTTLLYNNGAIMPRLSGEIERMVATGSWQKVGHFTARLQQVKRTEEDLEDIHMVFSVRINPKG